MIKNVVSIALTTYGISILSRETLTLPIYPTLSTRAKKRELKNKKMVDGDGGLVV